MEPSSANRVPGRGATTVMVMALAEAVAVGSTTASDATWDLPVLGVLLAFAVVSDLWAIDTTANPGARHRLLMSGSFISLVLAMVLLGGAPAATVGATVILVGHLRFHERTDLFLNNLVAYTWFPLVGGIAFHHARDTLGVGSDDVTYYALVIATFALALALNFLVIAGYNRWVDGVPILATVRRAVLPVIQWDLASAVLAATVAYSYVHYGRGALVLFGIVMLSTQRLLGQVFAAERRAAQLQARMEDLAALHLGLLNTMIRTLDLRDRMTARHSAAVAHYAREIAAAIGMSEDEQHVVHTAGLLHDIGKFNLPDDILKADVPLTDADWELIRAHPDEGARLISYLDGYEEAGSIVRAHHERFDGGGYPLGIAGMHIPMGARIISVADTYDVLTSRDSYRKPIPPDEALAELRRVAGSQLDPAVVSVFIDLMGSKQLRYRHGEEADFDAELALDARIEDYLVAEKSRGFGVRDYAR